MSLYLCIHVVFLIAVSVRLQAIGYGRKTVFGIIVFGLGLWPIVFVIGFFSGFKPMYYNTGVPLIIGINMLFYVYLEARILLENDGEREARRRLIKEEDDQHVQSIAKDEAEIAEMVLVKSYVGDDSRLVAVSDLGKLKAANIHCRIEGSLVRSIFVSAGDLGSACALLGLESSAVDDADRVGVPQSP